MTGLDPRAKWLGGDAPEDLRRADRGWMESNDRLTELRPQLEAADALAAACDNWITGAASFRDLTNALDAYLAARNAHLTEIAGVAGTTGIPHGPNTRSADGSGPPDPTTPATHQEADL